jgi:hypothetical protein
MLPMSPTIASPTCATTASSALQALPGPVSGHPAIDAPYRPIGSAGSRPGEGRPPHGLHGMGSASALVCTIIGAYGQSTARNLRTSHILS